MVSEQSQRQQDPQEPEQVHDEHEALKLGEQGPDGAVDGVAKQDDGPEEQGPVPVLHHAGVFRVREQDQALDHGAGQVAARRHQGLPARQGEPAGEVAEELARARRREHRDPVVLPARRRCHGDQLGERGEYGEGACPDHDEAVDDA